jgi:glycosyltransferase involved in cell wall biosynthesis
MTILFVLDSLGTGGSERSTADLWYYLRREKIDIRIVALRHRTEGIEKEIIAQNFNVYFVQSKGLFRQSKELLRVIKEVRPHIVHSILFKSNLRTRLARMRHKFVHVESLVNCSYDKVRLKDPKISRASFFYHKYLDKFTSIWVDHFHAVTDGVKVHYHEELGIPLNKISVVYRGRNENDYVSERKALRTKYLREFNLPADALLIIHVGRQEYQKGHLVLLNAITSLGKDELKRCAFILVGREGNSTSSIRSFLSSNDRAANLVWLGHRLDVPQLLASADIFVFPSLYEGIGGVLIEAQAACLPIVCNDIPVLREVVVRDQSAFMHTNENELGSSLSRLINNEELRIQMGKAGLKNFRTRFSMSGIAESMNKFYRDLLG